MDSCCISFPAQLALPAFCGQSFTRYQLVQHHSFYSSALLLRQTAHISVTETSARILRNHMANITPIVGDQYVTSTDSQLAVVRKALQIQDGNFTITDAEGGTLFQLKEKLVSLSDKKTLYDGANTAVLSLHKKTFTVHATHEVFAGETDTKLFDVKKGSVRGAETYEVFVAGTEGADYVIKGDFAHRDYNVIYKDELIVADVSKANFSLSSVFGGSKHKYGVKVKAGVDQAFIASLVTIIDSIHSEEADSSDDE